MLDKTVTVEWSMDMWEWQGVASPSLELDVEDFEGMGDRQIRQAIKDRIYDEVKRLIPFIYDENTAVREITKALKS